jgi:hypothetical protein
MVLAYLMKEENKTLKEALIHTKSRRNEIDPNR